MQAILEFFNKFIDTVSKDLQFVIDDISNEDSFAVGVTWHLGMFQKRNSLFVLVKCSLIPNFLT